MINDKDKNVEEYSGGMKRRIGIIQTFINNPKIILLDEPTAGLDPMQRLIFKNYISEQSQDAIIIYSTHITEDIESICDNIILIKDGKIISNGTEEEVLRILENKIYEIDISENELMKLIQENQVINYRGNNKYYKVRLYSNKPMNGKKCVEPILEDLYWYYNKNIGDDAHVRIG